VGGADLLFIFVPTDFEVLRLDFMDERFGLLAEDDDNEKVDDDEETLDPLNGDDVIERPSEVGVVLPLEFGDDITSDCIKLLGERTNVRL